MSCSDRNKEYYTLKPLYDAGGTLYTPVDNERNQIREVITKEEAENLIAEMPEIDIISVKDEKKRESLYKETLLKNQCRDWISLIKTSYMRKKTRLASGKKTINVDERYMNSAEGFLYGELAVALGIKRDEVKKFIMTQLDKMEVKIC